VYDGDRVPADDNPPQRAKGRREPDGQRLKKLSFTTGKVSLDLDLELSNQQFEF
jgi:hypothetical protein